MTKHTPPRINKGVAGRCTFPMADIVQSLPLSVRGTHELFKGVVLADFKDCPAWTRRI